MSFLKSSVYSFLNPLIKILTTMLFIKLVSTFGGHEGIIKFGYLLNIVSIVTAASSFGISAGVIKLVAEYNFKNNKKKLNDVVNSSFSITLISSVLISIILIFFSFIYLETIKIYILSILFFLPFCIGYSSIINAYFYGVGLYRYVFYSGLITSIFVIFFLFFNFKSIDSIFLIFLLQFFILFCFTYFFYFLNIKQKIYFSFKFTKIARNLLFYSSIAVAGIISSPLLQIVLRYFLEGKFDINDVSYWQVIMKINDLYFIFIASFASIYFLPYLSSVTSKKLFNTFIIDTFIKTLPLLLLSLIILNLFANDIFLLIFDYSFLPAINFLPFISFIIIFRYLSCLFSYSLISLSAIKYFVLIELFSFFTTLLLTYFLTIKYGFLGVFYAMALSSVVIFLTYLFLFYYVDFYNEKFKYSS